MQPKDTPDSNHPEIKKNTFKKKITDTPDRLKKIDISLLKKNEFALIIFGALLLTTIIFFLFFRSPDTKPQDLKISTSSSSFADLEKRIEKMEQAFQLQQQSAKAPVDKLSKAPPEFSTLKDRVARLETAFSVKFDSLTEKMEKIEKSISQSKDRPVAAVVSKPVPEKASVKTSEPAPDPEQKISVPVKKAMKKEKAGSLFHTVQKGETLYSIGKKYNVSIDDLQKLNKLSPDSPIFPGDDILIH